VTDAGLVLWVMMGALKPFHMFGSMGVEAVSDNKLLQQHFKQLLHH
jgi:hypothetical protein